MSASVDTHSFEIVAPFPGHPFGGLCREDRAGRTVEAPQPPSDADSGVAGDTDNAGFDFHLGVYSRF